MLESVLTVRWLDGDRVETAWRSRGDPGPRDHKVHSSSKQWIKAGALATPSDSADLDKSLPSARHTPAWPDPPATPSPAPQAARTALGLSTEAADRPCPRRTFALNAAMHKICGPAGSVRDGFSYRAVTTDVGRLGEQDPDSRVALPRLDGAEVLFHACSGPFRRPEAGYSGPCAGSWWLHGNPGRRGHLDMLADDDGLAGPAAEGLAAAGGPGRLVRSTRANWG